MGLLLVLAGCNGGPGNGDGENGGPGYNATYEFSAGENYTYDLALGSLEPTKVSWNVTSVNDGDVTVEFNAQGQTTELTGNQSSIYQEGVNNQVTGIFTAVARIPPVMADGHSLEDGNDWTFEPDDTNLDVSEDPNSWDLEVNGTDTVDGVDCTVVEGTENTDSEAQSYTACIAEDYPFALSVTFESSSTVSIDLASHERP
jgi:hypothetical protein